MAKDMSTGDVSLNTAVNAAGQPALTPFMRWAVLLLLATGVLIAFVDRTSISSALAVKSFVSHFGMTDVDRGWVNSAFFWSYAVMCIPAGWLVDRYGAKVPYALCFAAWCLATAATGAMTALTGLIVMRAIVGAAEAVVVGCDRLHT